MLRVCLLSLVVTASPVDEAEKLLSAGKLDDVLFALDGKPVSAAERPRAAKVLGEAAQKAWAAKDAFMALQFAQMALKHDDGQVQALEAGARAAMSQQQFQVAEDYADKWIGQAPEDGRARVLRASLAVEAGEWSRAVGHLDAVKPEPVDAQLAAGLRKRAAKELKDRTDALSTIASLERQMAKAQAESAGRPRPPGIAPRAASGSAEVVLYSTSWCGYCKKARAYLQKKGVSFVEKDLEKDESAAKELAEKAARQGVRPQGVPVIDVKGTLVLGFDQKQIDRLL